MGDVMMDIDASVPNLESILIARGSDVPTRIRMTQGGSAANTAAWLRVNDQRASLLGAIGEDSSGELVTNALRSHGVMPLLSVHPDFPTGMCIVITESDGSRTMLPSSGANAHFDPDDIEALWPTDSLDHFHLSAYSLFHHTTGKSAIAAIKKARQESLTVSIDPASHALIPMHSSIVIEALSSSNLLLANLEEAQSLFRIATREPTIPIPDREQMLHTLLSLLSSGTDLSPVVVVTLGNDGAIAMARNGIVEQAPAGLAEVIESTAGAGDAFNAGFLTHWIAHPHDIVGALYSGNNSAASALTRVGASPEPRNS